MSLKADYVNVESPAQQRLVTRAGRAVNMYRQGVNQMYANYPSFIANLIGFVLYSLTISFFDWRILIVIIVMTVVGSILEAKARKYQADIMDDRYKIWGRLYYLKQQSISVPNSKDIRIYNMADWFRTGFERLIIKNQDISCNQAKKYYAITASDTFFIAIQDILAYGILTAGVINGTLTIAEYALRFRANIIRKESAMKQFLIFLVISIFSMTFPAGAAKTNSSQEESSFTIVVGTETGAITVEDAYIQRAILLDGSETVVFEGKLQIIDMSREIKNAVKTTVHEGCAFVPLEFFEEFMNTTNIEGTTITIAPSMCEAYTQGIN